VSSRYTNIAGFAKTKRERKTGRNGSKRRKLELLQSGSARITLRGQGNPSPKTVKSVPMLLTGVRK
jgi:hypothetical protein